MALGFFGKLGWAAAGGAAWKGLSAGVGGVVGLGINPYLGAAVGKGMMKLPGGMGAGMQKATGITRDETIVRGMKPHSETRAIAIRPIKKRDDFSTKLQILDKTVRLAYKTSIQNNRELIYIQKMLQGPTAARAKEMRMESARQLTAPSIINNYIMAPGGGKGGDGAGGSMLGGLGSLLGMPLALVGLSALMRKFFGEADKGRTTAEEKAGKQRNRFSERLVESIEKLRERMSKNSWRNLKANANRVSSLGRNIIDNLKLFDKANSVRFDKFGKGLGNTLRISFDSWGKNFQNQLRRINLRLQIPYDAGEFSKGAKYIPRDVTRFKPIEAKPWDYKADEFARTKYQPKLDYDRFRPFEGRPYEAGEFSKLPYQPKEVTRFKPIEAKPWDYRADEFAKIKYQSPVVSRPLSFDTAHQMRLPYIRRAGTTLPGADRSAFRRFPLGPLDASKYAGEFRLPETRRAGTTLPGADVSAFRRFPLGPLDASMYAGERGLPEFRRAGTTLPGADAAQISRIGTMTPGEYSRSLAYTGPRETKGYVKPYISAGQRTLPPPTRTIVGEGAAAARISGIGTTPPGIPYRGAAGSFGAERGGTGGVYETPTNRQALKLFSKILGESVETMESATRRIPAFIKRMGESLGDWFAKQNVRLERWYKTGLAAQVIMKLLAIVIIGTALREAWKTVWKEPDANGDPRTWKGYGQWLKAYGKDLGIGIALWIAISKFVDVLIGIFFVSGIGWPAGAALFVAKTLLVIWLHHWIMSGGKNAPRDMHAQWLKAQQQASYEGILRGTNILGAGSWMAPIIAQDTSRNKVFKSESDRWKGAGTQYAGAEQGQTRKPPAKIITPAADKAKQAGMFSGATSLWKRFFGGGKDKTVSKGGFVAPKAVYEYLLSKGVDRIHALGILANIEAESSFQIGVVNSIGAVGLFQYLGSRKYGNPKGPGTVHPGFLALVPDWQTNWRAQINYALNVEPESESRMGAYLRMPFATAADAAENFCLMFERPERKESKGKYRRTLVAKYIQRFAKPRVRPGFNIKRGYNPASSTTPTTIDRGAGHYEFRTRPRQSPLKVWVPDNTQAYWDANGAGGGTPLIQTNVVESSIGPSVATTVHNHWDPRGETFTPPDSSMFGDMKATMKATLLAT